jgi:hypothetical protein
VRSPLLSVTIGLLAVILNHGFLEFRTITIALVVRHSSFMVLKAALQTLDRHLMFVKGFVMSVQHFLQLGQLGQCRPLLHAPLLKVIPPHRVVALPRPMIGMHAGKRGHFLFHDVGSSKNRSAVLDVECWPLILARDSLG